MKTQLPNPESLSIRSKQNKIPEKQMELKLENLNFKLNHRYFKQ